MNIRSVLTLCTALVVGGTFIAGSVTAAGKADEKTPINDTWLTEDKDEAITARVKAHFAKDAHLKHADIAVQTNAGVVSLTGEVPDIMTSANASWTAWFVPGVKSVKNDLTVKEKA